MKASPDSLTIPQLIRREGSKQAAYRWLVRAGLDLHYLTFLRWSLGGRIMGPYVKALQAVGVEAQGQESRQGKA